MVDYFKELPFYNKYIEKPNIKRLKNINLLSRLPSISSIKDLFSDLLNETKCFKYQITLKVKLKKNKLNG